MDFGYLRVAAAVPKVKVADVSHNVDTIIELIEKANLGGVNIVVFPELCITAYTCGDLFHHNMLITGALSGLYEILNKTAFIDIISIVGMPLEHNGRLYNTACVISKGQILGIVPKSYIPNNSEFYEKRWFSSGSHISNSFITMFSKVVPFGTDILFSDDDQKGVTFGVEICEDLWGMLPPSSFQAKNGAVVLFNLSASNDIIGKYEYRRSLVLSQSAKCSAGYIYASAGSGESTTDVVFSGHAMICEYGSLLAELPRFQNKSSLIMSDIDVERLLFERRQSESFYDSSNSNDNKFRNIPCTIPVKKTAELLRYIDPIPFVPSTDNQRNERCSEIFAIQNQAIITRFEAVGLKKAVIGISGGLDSTLALLAMSSAFDRIKLPRQNIIAVTMPGFGTTDSTHENAINLIKSIGATFKEIDIKLACLQHFQDISHDPQNFDITYENSQARERTQILMDLANQEDGIVIGTGDLSEIALGWCTYNGDHMSMYAINCGIPKTLVQYMVRWVKDNACDETTATVLGKILGTPISPELIPPDSDGNIIQKTEDIIGSYELHDFFLYHMIRLGQEPSKIKYLAEIAFKGKFSRNQIKKSLSIFIKRFFAQQFKRSCMPDGPKIGSVSLSPRGDWRMPSDANSALWLMEMEG